MVLAVGMSCLAIDSAMYGKLTFPPLNILLYNSLGGRGDELYGVEPVSYYVKNLFLTLGLCWPLGAAAPLLVIRKLLNKARPGASARSEVLQLVCCAPVVLWIGLLFPRPHKVLYSPVFPSLSGNAGGEVSVPRLPSPGPALRPEH